jgi:putative hydrolase of the HAD superfamily
MPRAGDAVDAILFDLGGVLIELVGVEQMLAWSPQLADTAELWRRWLASPAVRRFETGGSTDGAFAEAIVEEFGLAVDGEAFLRAFVGWPRALYPGVPELLTSLAPRYRLASVSNTNAIHWERFCAEWELDRLFHANFPSHRVGRLKPDAGYFAHVLAALELPAERVLFVDDNRVNVEAAAAMGIVARHVTGFADLRETLAALGVTASEPSIPD